MPRLSSRRQGRLISATGLAAEANAAQNPVPPQPAGQSAGFRQDATAWVRRKALLSDARIESPEADAKRRLERGGPEQTVGWSVENREAAHPLCSLPNPRINSIFREQPSSLSIEDRRGGLCRDFRLPTRGVRRLGRRPRPPFPPSVLEENPVGREARKDVAAGGAAAAT